MRSLALLTTAFLAATASAIGGFFGRPIEVAPYDDSLSVPGDNPLQHCQDPKDDILDLESVDLDPNPPKPGKTLTITATGTISQNITTGAKVKLQVKYGLITLIKSDFDLCDNVKEVDLKCPIEKGKLTLTKDVDLPNEIPPGKYTVLADAETEDEERITCLTAEVSFKRGGGGKTEVEFLRHQGL